MCYIMVYTAFSMGTLVNNMLVLSRPADNALLGAYTITAVSTV